MSYVYHFADSEGQITAPNIEQGSTFGAQFSGIKFKRNYSQNKELVLGKRKVNHWVRFCLKNVTNTPQSLVIATEPAIIAEVDFYPQQPKAASFQTGRSKIFSSRDLNSPEFHFSVHLEAGERSEFYFRIRSSSDAYLLAKLWDGSSYLVAKEKFDLLDGIIVGIMFGLILYNILLYASVRQSSSIWYIDWVACSFGWFVLVDGRVLQYGLPNSPALVRILILVWRSY